MNEEQLKAKYAEKGWVNDTDTDEKIGFTKDGWIHDYCRKTGHLTVIDGNWTVNLRTPKDGNENTSDRSNIEARS